MCVCSRVEVRPLWGVCVCVCVCVEEGGGEGAPEREGRWNTGGAVEVAGGALRVCGGWWVG